jgi:sodium-dependent phosphate cotransporter
VKSRGITISRRVFNDVVLLHLPTGQIAGVIKRVLNANIPYVPWITGYLAITIGAVMTFLVQSSSVFTSALTPLVGVGVISLERVYPLTLGSNIGTTTTSVIAALAAPPEQLRYTLQISLCHFIFNVAGILLFYPVPFTRFPIPMAKFLGETTAKYRWFSIGYLIMMFFFMPGVVLALSFAGTITLVVVLAPIVILMTAVVIISILQRKCPTVLPVVMRNWKFLPIYMRSLEPLDRLISSCVCCKGKQSEKNETPDGLSNLAYE